MKAVSPLFSNKDSYNANIKLTDNNTKVVEVVVAVSSLKLSENSFVINDEHKKIQDPIEKIIVKYQFHPSILIIKKKKKILILFVLNT